MKIKKGVEISTSDFWYDLTLGGYIKPREILENENEAIRVEAALEVLEDFFESCNSQIEGFLE